MTLCRELKLFPQGTLAIDSSKFKAVSSRDRNLTPAKIDKRKEQIEQSVEHYLQALDTADRTSPLLGFGPKYARLTTKIEILREQMRRIDQIKERLKDEPDEKLPLTDLDSRSMKSQANRAAPSGLQRTGRHT